MLYRGGMPTPPLPTTDPMTRATISILAVASRPPTNARPRTAANASPLASGGAQRSPVTPEVPSLAEAGLKDCVPNLSRSVVVPGAGHFVPHEKPEPVAQAIIDLLARAK